MKNDILQYAIDVSNPIDEKTITDALEKAGINVLGIEWKASWSDADYHDGKKPYASD